MLGLTNVREGLGDLGDKLRRDCHVRKRGRKVLLLIRD